MMGPEDLGNERWKSEQEEIDKMAATRRQVHKAEKAHERDAAERGETVAKTPWWKFWAK
jgi:hypothetical protein